MSTINQQTYVEAMSEILVILKRRGFCWGKCLGCNGQPGMSFDELLIELQSTSTMFNWDDALLTQITRLGLRFGTLRQYPVGFYFFNANMLFENALNYRFLPVIPSLCQPRLYPQPLVIY